MSKLEASPYIFDFSAATSAVYHDKLDPGDGNTFWPGVDFRVIEFSQHQLWIEVKSWIFPGANETTEKHKAKKDFNNKLDGQKAEEFRNEIVGKFLGTTSYLHWSKIGAPQDKVTYVVLLIPPNKGSMPLFGPFQDRLRNKFKNAQARPWGRCIEYAVMDLQAFEQAFPKYPVTRP